MESKRNILDHIDRLKWFLRRSYETYTRALQTASILSKELGIDIVIETDLKNCILILRDITGKQNLNELAIKILNIIGARGGYYVNRWCQNYR